MVSEKEKNEVGFAPPPFFHWSNRGRHRGRRRCRRKIGRLPDVTFFKPAGVPLSEAQIIDLTYDELEALRLVDLEGLTQEEAAERMGISRRTFWSDLKNVRRKVALALTRGYAIRITGGNFLLTENRI
ncbi:MAG TPA: DUF134 domain-containing protein [Thermoplasmata archaeon]|nr:DUF134 domain-containing protein [Thermoplasmata archaeon]